VPGSRPAHQVRARSAVRGPHTLGAEILGISPGNFRVRLHRARSDLLQLDESPLRSRKREQPVPLQQEDEGHSLVDQILGNPTIRSFFDIS
jgi:hypothetical protein